MNKKTKRLLSRWYAKNNNGVDSLEIRHRLINTITNHTEHGMIGLLTAGTDCDGYSWQYNHVIKATLESFNSWLKEFNRGLDGPADYRIVVPSIAKEKG